MKLKSYQSNSVEAAIRLAKVELGEDAIFMGSRENGPCDESSARYEVTFAIAVGELSHGGEKPGFTPGRGAAESGSRRLSLPAWVGVARRALGVAEAPRPDDSGRKFDGTPSARGRLPARLHWQDYLPAGEKPSTPSELGREQVSAKPEVAAGDSRSAPAFTAGAVTEPQNHGSVTAGVWPVTAESVNPSAGGTSSLAIREEPEKRRFTVIGRPASQARPLLDSPGEEQGEAHPELSVQPDQSLEMTRATGIEVLVSQGMCASAARRLVGEALGGCDHPFSIQLLQQQLEVSIDKGFQIDASIGCPTSASQPTIALFVGPAGSGKTTTICKLAARLGVEASRSVHLVSLDHCRLGASEQLGRFADLLDAPFTVVEECGDAAAAIRRAIAPVRDSGTPLVLIDTPGYGPGEWKQARALADALRGLPGLDTHVVVAATSSQGHLRRSLDAFGIFRPNKMLITKLDECAEAGAIVGETLRCRLPISYFSTGQRIPEDIAAASSERLVRQLLQAF